MPNYPSRPPHSPFWLPPEDHRPVDDAALPLIATLCELLAAPTAPMLVKTINIELRRRDVRYTFGRRPGAQRR